MVRTVGEAPHAENTQPGDGQEPRSRPVPGAHTPSVIRGRTSVCADTRCTFGPTDSVRVTRVPDIPNAQHRRTGIATQQFAVPGQPLTQIAAAASAAVSTRSTRGPRLDAVQPF